MTDMCRVKVKDQMREYERGTTYQKIAEDFQFLYQDRIVLVFTEPFRLQELHKRLDGDREISFVTVGDPIGMKTYKRSICLLLVKAIYDVAGHDRVRKARILYSIDKGYYCKLDGKVQVNQEFLEAVAARMHEMAEEALPIKKRSINTEEAVKLFEKYEMYDKMHLFEYRRVSRVNIYSINEFEDYYYGYMVPDTSYLKFFSLHLYNEGFVIQMPTTEATTVVPEFHPQEKLFQVLKESTEWGDLQDIETVGALNDMAAHQDVRTAVLVQEAFQERKISEIAQMIASKGSVKIILIAGPSSSGKTTFSHRLSVQLAVNGLQPHPIAVDNYFVDRENTPKDEFGNYNFECIEAIDVEAFNRDMSDLLAGKEIIIPTFDFKSGHRNYSGKPFKIAENDVLVIEGIHCLNPKLTEKLPAANKLKIYISALTQLNIDEHNRIPTTDGRLIRRIVRDARTRGTSAQQTIAMWPSVRRGEEKNIFPFQEEADVMFNSALIYELAVLKQYVEPMLFGVEKNCAEYLEAKRLLKFLDYFVGINSENIPNTSLLREFVGGGCFDV
ncbi:MAG: nucleoside kinase [Hespellia sp.]|nr:nucleoside kinase [Hespellia sp.]